MLTIANVWDKRPEQASLLNLAAFVSTLPPQLGSAGARVQPAAESDRASDAPGADPPLLTGQSRLQYLRYELAHCILIADNIGPRLWFECDRQPANTLKFASLML